MGVKILVLLSLLLVLTGCGSQKTQEPADTTANALPNVSAQDTTEEPVQKDRMTECLAFKVKDDTMTLLDGGTMTISGTKISGNGIPQNLSERFVEAEADNGVLPSCEAITLLFEEETPLQFTWYLDDGYGFTDKGTVVTGPQSGTTFYLGKNLGQMLSSDSENTPNRKLRIVCQYLDHNVEYLMLMDAV